MVGGVAADLPDTGVRFGPALGDAVGEAAHRPPGLAVQPLARSGEQPGGVQYPAVAIRLVLVGCVVTDPDRSAAGVAGPTGELAFRRGVLAVQGEQHGQAGPVQPGGVQRPGHEQAGLLGLADAQEGADADAGVAGPGEAVVPVANATRVLGQGRGGGGDRRPGWRVGEQPQCQQAAHHRGPLREQLVVDAVTPRLPAALVLHQGVPGSLGIDVDQRLAVGHGDLDGDRSLRADRDLLEVSWLQPQLGSGLDGDRERAPLADQDGTAVRGAGWAATLAEAGIELDLRLERAALRGQATDQQCSGQQLAGDLGHHALGEDQAAAIGLPDGLQRGRGWQVAAARPEHPHAAAGRRDPAHHPAHHRLVQFRQGTDTSAVAAPPTLSPASLGPPQEGVRRRTHFSISTAMKATVEAASTTASWTGESASVSNTTCRTGT